MAGKEAEVLTKDMVDTLYRDVGITFNLEGGDRFILMLPAELPAPRDPGRGGGLGPGQPRSLRAAHARAGRGAPAPGPLRGGARAGREALELLVEGDEPGEVLPTLALRLECAAVVRFLTRVAR